MAFFNHTEIQCQIAGRLTSNDSLKAEISKTQGQSESQRSFISGKLTDASDV